MPTQSLAAAYSDPGATPGRVGVSPVYSDGGVSSGSLSGSAAQAQVVMNRATERRRLSSMDRYFSATVDDPEEVLNQEYDDFSPEHESDLKFDEHELFAAQESFAEPNPREASYRGRATMNGWGPPRPHTRRTAPVRAAGGTECASRSSWRRRLRLPSGSATDR